MECTPDGKLQNFVTDRKSALRVIVVKKRQSPLIIRGCSSSSGDLTYTTTHKFVHTFTTNSGKTADVRTLPPTPLLRQMIDSPLLGATRRQWGVMDISGRSREVARRAVTDAHKINLEERSSARNLNLVHPKNRVSYSTKTNDFTLIYEKVLSKTIQIGN